MKIKPLVFWLVLAACILVSNLAYSDTRMSVTHSSQLTKDAKLWGFTIGVQSTENPYYFSVTWLEEEWRWTRRGKKEKDIWLTASLDYLFFQQEFEGFEVHSGFGARIEIIGDLNIKNLVSLSVPQGTIKKQWCWEFMQSFSYEVLDDLDGYVSMVYVMRPVGSLKKPKFDGDLFINVGVLLDL